MMQAQDSSDEEDVFSCGRCKEHFTTMDSFMDHKKSQACRKARHRPRPPLETSPMSKVPGEQESTESIQETSHKASTPLSTSLHQGPTFSDASTRLQDVLATLQGGQQVGQFEFSSGTSESQDGQALYHVFEKLLGVPSRDLPLRVRPGMETHQGFSGGVEKDDAMNLIAEQTAASDICNFGRNVSEVPHHQVELVMTEQSQSIIPEIASGQGGEFDEDAGTGERGSDVSCSQSSGRQPSLHEQSVLLSDVDHLKNSAQATENEECNASQKESPQLLEIPEAFTNSQSAVCKFCSEILENADSLFNHYVEVHKMKSGAALEFLRQSAFKKKRGRPPKSLKNCKPVCCPHCSVSFNSKTVCAAHIRKHHRDTAVKASSSSLDFPSARRRKCSRCSFQTTVAKDLTAHMHSCRGNKAQLLSEKADDKTTKEKSNAAKEIQSGAKAKSQRGRKRPRDVQEDSIDKEQDVADKDAAEEEEEDHDNDKMQNEPGRNKPLKGQVTCPECNKTMHTRGLKRHQVRCANKNRFVCQLCQHKSRESYDHTVHVDNHRTWVKAQATYSWINLSKESVQTAAASSTTQEADAASVPNASSTPLLLVDSSTVMGNGESIDFASTVDLEELALLTQVEGENQSIQQEHTLTVSGNSLDTGGGLKTSDIISNTSSSVNNQDGDTGETSAASSEQDSTPVSGVSQKTNPRDLKCKICYTWFARGNFPKHMLQAHSMVKRFQCREKTCKVIFAKLEEFKGHITSHSMEDMFRCGCRGCVNRRLITPEKMDNIRKEKMRDYYKHMSHKCSKCWVKFPSQGSLDRHLRKESHHHPCSICTKVQVSKRQLRMHLVIHQAERAYLCEVCGQNFKTKRDLNKHSFSHNNIRPYQCPECAKCFSFRNKMTRHMVTVHSAKKPYSCTWDGCSRAFSRKDKLNDHIKTHQVAFPFKCQYCSKGFYRKDNLKDHEILHTREFRFNCAICNRGFMRPKILERHCLTEHAAMTTLQATTPTQEAQTESPNRSVTEQQQISYVLCDPYVYGNIDQLTSFQDNVQETEVHLMQNAAAVVLGNGQNQFQIDGTDTFPVMTLGT